MNASITTLKDPEGNVLYPKTRTDAAYDGSGNRLDQTISGMNTNISSLQSDLGSKSSASAVTGDDAFSKISSLNSDKVNYINPSDVLTTITAVDTSYTATKDGFVSCAYKGGTGSAQIKLNNVVLASEADTTNAHTITFPIKKGQEVKTGQYGVYYVQVFGGL